MKKTYMQPQVHVAFIGTTTFICGSQDIKSDKGIGYGGVDEEGTLEPSARRHYDDWDDEDDSDY